MARIRTVKPEFFTSEDIVSLSPLARLLYIAIWCEADKAGRMVWKPRTFKLRYLPGDACDADALCAELVAAGLVVLYGDGYAYIPSFARHQHINPRESASSLPSPDAQNTTPDASQEELTRGDASARDDDAQGGREGKGREGEDSEAKASDGADAPATKSGESQKTAEELAKADLWKAAVSVLEAGGCPKAQCRTFMGKLVGDYTFPTVQKAVAAAVNEQPADAREYLKATCMRLKGERKDPLTVPSDDAARTAAALAEQARHAREVASSPTAKAAMEAVKARFGVGKREETA